MPLPEAILSAWDADTPAKLGGLMQMAGNDPAQEFRSRAIKAHPWIGLEIEFPFPEVGRGRITACLIHPRGKLMFDVEFPEPVPSIQGLAPNFYVALKSHPEQVHRFFGSELKALIA